ncbi:MAG: type II toxin-antitoxin system PemK/MazF family toxin [Candidatus Sumerlaeota bacterium]|nr:type II toxin-antitoxin system PemK/MazF family toxin [Candidatus Sumerlaeota bacterium]
MQRGEIWWATLPRPMGSEPGYRRPVVIVQSDDFNRSCIHTVVAAAITSNLALAQAPGNVLLRPRASGLPKESVVNVSQLLTMDKRFLEKKVKMLDPIALRRIDDGLRLALHL